MPHLLERLMLNTHRSTSIAVLAVVIAIPGTANAQKPGGPLIAEVARAMGGKDRILAVRTLVLEGTGENYNLGQNILPDAPLPMYAVTAFKRSIDFANKRWLLDQTREPRFLTANTAAVRQRLGFDSISYDVVSDTLTRRASLRADIDRADELVFHPVGLIQTALRAGTELTEEKSRGRLRY